MPVSHWRSRVACSSRFNTAWGLFGASLLQQVAVATTAFGETPAAAASLTASHNVSKPLINFVFFFPDTIRAEALSSYGMPLKTTPNLDSFASTGVRFAQAHVQHTQCSPSRVSMLTGRYMHVRGHRVQTDLVQPYEFNYLQILKQNGYHIEYHGKNDAISPDAFNLSVSNWAGGTGVCTGPAVVQYPTAGYYSMLHGGCDVDKNDAKANGDYRSVITAVEWMKASPPMPFLLFLPGMGAHPPYGSPREFNDKWSVESVKAHVKLRPPFLASKPKYHSFSSGIPHYRNLSDLNEDFFYKIQATYLGMVSYVDWIFGELLRGIKEAGLEDNTAIFVSSDHGDFAGDFRMVEKWPGGADDVLTRVPLIARVPGASPLSKGFVAQAPVALMDVPHTICLLAGIDVKGDGSGKYGVNFGESLVSQLVHGVEGDMGRFVYSEGGFGFRNEVFPMGSDHVPNDPKGYYYPRALEEMSDDGNGSPKWVMRRNLTHKLVYRPKGESELYDLVDDPRELTNRWDVPAYAAIRSELLGGLLEWMVQTGDVSPVHKDPRGLPSYPYAASTCASGGSLGPYQSGLQATTGASDEVTVI
eukprot:TRINITY_DN15693_c0_g1_i1.p1 TRINITY_DN15693_c0_g1~~TRINITY_DN15693_c0_g1_i1.p1  ORF type:complete len:615 (+),score=62.81 TRINITY_DN15693_c0_g1_i1:89-1846(+)